MLGIFLFRIVYSRGHHIHDLSCHHIHDLSCHDINDVFVMIFMTYLAFSMIMVIMISMTLGVIMISMTIWVMVSMTSINHCYRDVSWRRGSGGVNSQINSWWKHWKLTKCQSVEMYCKVSRKNHLTVMHSNLILSLVLTKFTFSNPHFLTKFSISKIHFSQKSHF